MAKYNLPSLPRIGDSRGIGDYKSVGDWAESRGGGTLQALANLFNIGGQIAGQADEMKREKAMRQALLDMAQKENLLPGEVPDKINTVGMEIPTKGLTPKTERDEQKALAFANRNDETMSTKEMASMYDKYRGLSSSQLLQLMAQRKAQEPKPQKGFDLKDILSMGNQYLAVSDKLGRDNKKGNALTDLILNFEQQALSPYMNGALSTSSVENEMAANQRESDSKKFNMLMTTDPRIRGGFLKFIKDKKLPDSVAQDTESFKTWYKTKYPNDYAIYFGR